MLTELKFIEQNVCLKEQTYYKMGGIAQFFARPNTFQEVSQAINFAKNHHLPIAILGAGSNCVFSDDTFAGLVITLQNLTQWWWESNEVLFVEAGVTNTDVSNICLKSERAGASWMYRMPGQIGASVRMNARCYGGEMSQIVSNILTIDTNGYLKTYSSQEIFKGYKSTRLMDEPEIVVGVRFYFPHIEESSKLLKHMKFCENNRNSKQHFLYPSCGSTFKNNYAVGKPSGQIFDELGLKGTKRGDAEISQYHGNFIWNKNKATTNDMLSLCAYMRNQAITKANANLDLEVQPIGSFSIEQFEACQMQNLGPYTKTQNSIYTGLLNAPNQDQSQSYCNQYPIEIFSSFFTEYFKKKSDVVPNVCVKVLQLCSFDNAQKNPDSPFLRWMTMCDESYLNVFSIIPTKNQKIERLWEYSVSEIFLANPNQPQYLEAEITPTGEYILFEFEDIRKQKKTMLKPCHIIPIAQSNQSIQPNQSNKNTFEFGMEFSFSQLEQLIVNNRLKLQCALSLGQNQFYLAPFWNLGDSCFKADFHNPQYFFEIKFS